MKVNAVSLNGVEYAGDAKSVNVRTLSGEITALDNHIPLVTIIEQCDVRIITANGDEKRIRARSGFLEIARENAVTILID